MMWPDTTFVSDLISTPGDSDSQACKKSNVRARPFFCDLLYHQLWQKARDIYGWAVEYNQSETGAISKWEKGSADTLKRLIQNAESDGIWEKVIDSLKMGDQLLFNVFMPRVKYDLLTNHPVHVAILSMKLGMAIDGYPEKELKRLGLAALVHDLGMVGILLSIKDKDEDLSQDEIKAIERHPSIGRNYLSHLGKDYEWLARVCYQEHERENGQGYPEGLSKDQIHVMARIIGLMDTIDAMIHPRPWKNPLPPPEVIQTLLTTQKDFFAPHLVKSLIREVSPFPPGSFIRLNSKEIGQVIRVNKKHPLRPDIIIYYDSSGMPMKDPKIIQLQSHPILHISGAVDMDEIPSRALDIIGNWQ
ncbi:MAG: HD-GYP domain-containing protein [bacterium]